MAGPPAREGKRAEVRRLTSEDYAGRFGKFAELRAPETLALGAGRSGMPSSVIRSCRYDPALRRLELQFVSGRRYQYHDVPEETWRELRQAFSKGEFFNERIRDQFRFTREN